MQIIDSVSQDVRYALRTLRASPGFTAVAVMILALGIGANTAIFSVVSAVLLKPLPFEDPARLVLLWEDFRPIGGPDRVEPSPATYSEWKARARSYSGMALLEGRNYNLTGDGEPERLTGVRSDTNLFSLLGLQPLLGRTFAPDDEGPGALPTVVISDALWARRFRSDPNVIGRTMELDGLKRTVIGVVPSAFRYPADETSLWVPAAYTPEELSRRFQNNYYVVARLNPGVTLEQARAELATLAVAIKEAAGVPTAPLATVSNLQEHLAREARPTLLVLLGAVATILLITCANVANLLLARAARRQRELAVRKALGAVTGRVLRQLMTEGAVLAAGGVTLGMLFAAATFAYLERLVPQNFPGDLSPGLDWRVLAFTIGVTVLTVALFGAGPAIAGARHDFNETLKKGVGANASPRSGRLRSSLVVAEIALTVVLLAVAGLLVRSYVAVLAVDPGFPAERLLLVQTALTPSQYGEPADRARFHAAVLERVRGLPGVESAGFVNTPPLVFKGGRVMTVIEGQPPPPPEQALRNIAANRAVTPGYLEALGVPLVSGRLLDERDSADAAPVAIVNSSFAKQYWPDADAVGRRFKLGSLASDAPWITVVGVVGDMRQMGLDVLPDREFYLAAPQNGGPIANAPFFWPRYLAVRTRTDPAALTNAVRAAIWAADADVPIASVRTMTEVLESDVASRDLQMTLVTSFAALALLLASVGLYGVLSYAVTQRTAELGLRIALGAQTGTVVRGVIRGAFALAATGIGLGLLGALGVTRFLGAFLFGVSPSDPATLAGVGMLLLAVTLLASFLPARRAATVDPVAALRSE
jgi:predicted permease